MTRRYSDEEFVAAWAQNGNSPTLVAKALGLEVSGVYQRRRRLSERGILLTTDPMDGRRTSPRLWSSLKPSAINPARMEIDIEDGTVIVFSDAHYWPGEPTPAHKALVSLIGSLKPRIVVANGDVLDGATISRHDREGWVQRPTLKQELDACKERMGEVEDAAGVDATLVWTLGNHDQRMERHLAVNAPAFEGMPGTTLPEHFPRWTFSMSLMVNPHTSPVMVRHRQSNGLHAAYNNTLRAGVSTVTGHLHRLLVSSWGDYRGRRYGVDTGTLANINGPQFGYAEDGPSPSGQGFAVLTFHEGELLPPELVEVRNRRAFFRGAPV